MKSYISVQDIKELIQSGQKELLVNRGIVMTDSARRLAEGYGIIIKDERPGISESIFTKTGLNETKSDSISEGAPLQQMSFNPGAGTDLIDLQLINGQVLIPEFGLLRLNIGIKDGRISSLSKEIIPAKQTLDLDGQYVFPGIIDPHIHLGLFAPLEEEIESETRAALLGGVTTAGCFFNQPTSYLSLLDKLKGLVNCKSNIDILPHLTLREPLHLQEMDTYLNDYGIRSFKMYFNGIPGILPHQPDSFVVKAMEEVQRKGNKAVICIHAENLSLVETATMEMLESRSPLTLEDWGQTHPEIAEEEAVMRAVFFASRLGVKLYLVHVSTSGAMKVLQNIKRPNIYVETTSPYLTLHDGSNAVKHKMEPPIRSEENMEGLWQAIKDGVVDTLGTDNVTMTTQEKQISLGMNKALPGYSALPTHLPSILNEGYHKRGIALEKLIPLMTINPAKVFGLYPKKGTILPGSDADLVIVDLHKEKRVDANFLGSRSDYSIFEGESIKGWPVMTIKNGRIAAQEGQLTNFKGGGALLGK